MIVGIFIIIGSAVVSYFAFQEGDYLMSGLGAVIAIVLVFPLFTMIKKLINASLYLFLPEEELIIHPDAKNAIPIK